MKDKPLSIKKLSWILLILGLVSFILYFVAKNSILQLGFRSTEDYDAARDTYVLIMLGGQRYTSGSAIKDMFMDMRGTFLFAGIFMMAIGLLGVMYFSRHPEKDVGTKIKLPQHNNSQQQTSNYYQRPVDSRSQLQSLNYSIPQTRGNSANAYSTGDSPNPSTLFSQKNSQAANNISQTKVGAKLSSELQSPGKKRVMLILALVATVLFSLGVGVFPYSLLSIAAGLCLIYFVIKKDQVQSFFAVFPVLLFVARFFLGETSYSGYDWITVLYRVCSYGFLAIIIFMDIGDVFLNFIVIEEDDISLLANILMFLGGLNTALAGVELFRGFEHGFNIIMFRSGSVAFWFCLALYYKFAQRPCIKNSVDVYAGKLPHPFHKICGPLRNLVIGIYAVATACIIAAPIILVNYINLLKHTASTGVYGYVASNIVLRLTIIAMLGLAGVLLIAGLFLVWVNRKIRLRSMAFLLYLEYACGAIILISIVMIFTVNALIGILMTIASTFGSYMLIKWISRSVQIRTYMGNGAYLDFSIYYLLNKKEAKPQPADENGYHESNQRIQQTTSDTLPSQAIRHSIRSTLSPAQIKRQNTSTTSSDDEWEIVAQDGGKKNDNDNDWEIVGDTDEWEIDEIKTAEQSNNQKEPESEWEIVPNQSVEYKREEFHRIPVRQDMCCICGSFLKNGYAILMTDNNGAEARVDENCWNAIQTILGEPSSQGNESALYLEKQLPFIDPLIGSTLSKQIGLYRSKLPGLNGNLSVTNITGTNNTHTPRRRRSDRYTESE